VSGVPWRIVKGFGLDDWIYWRLLLKSLLITINYNSSKSMTAGWTTTVLSSGLPSTVTDLVLIYESHTSTSRMNYEWRIDHEWLLMYDWMRSKSSQSHIATDGQSVSKSWCRVPDCLTVTVLFLFGALSDQRTGLPVYMLLAPASAVFLVSESLGACDHILLSQIWDFPFRRLLDSQGHGGGIEHHLHTGWL
jgi:hypothetical protein